MSFLRKYIIGLIFSGLCFGQAGTANAASLLHAEAVGVLQSDLDQPSGVALSRDGRAYVLDGVNGRVVVFNASGQRDITFGEQEGLNLPMAIAIAEGQVYVADSGNHRIAVFNLHGRFIKSLSLSSSPSAVAAPPEPVSLMVTDSVITWADRRNHQVCRTDANSGEQMLCWGRRGEGKAEFQFPFQLSVDRDGYLHVVDVFNARVQVFNHQGRRFAQVGRFGLESGELYRPNGLAFSDKGELLVSDVYRGTVSVYQGGRFLGLLYDGQGKPLRFSAPVALTVWRDRLYVVDIAQSRVEILRLYRKAMQQAARAQPRRAAVSQKNCVTCHLSWATNYTAAEGEEDGVAPVATPRMCYSCHHGVVIDSRRTIGRGEQHPDIHHQRKTGDMGQDRQRKDEIPGAFPLLSGKHGDKGLLSCGSCHTPHNTDTKNADTLYEAHANPWLRVLNKDGDLCQRCHESRLDSSLDEKHPLRGINHPVGIYFKPPPAGDSRGYASAASLHQGLPKTLRDRGLTLGKGQQMICQSCHQMHGAENEVLLPFADDRLCVACHERHYAKDKKQAREKGVHPVSIRLDEPVIIGDEKVERITCLTCHSLHGAKEGTPLLKFEYRDGKLCSHCHKDYDAVVNSDHDLRITARESKNRFGLMPEKAGVCGSCHTLHRGEGRMASLYAGQLPDALDKESDNKWVPERDKLCLACHRQQGIAEQAVVTHFSHPAKAMVLRSDPGVMPLSGIHGTVEEFGAIACITCHNPHRWQPKEQGQTQVTEQNPVRKNRDGNALNSFLRRRGAKGSFCIDCHGLETRVKYKYYHEKFTRDAGAEYFK